MSLVQRTVNTSMLESMQRSHGLLKHVYSPIMVSRNSRNNRGQQYTLLSLCISLRNLLYCEQCFSCQDCFGCIGLRNQKYCIGNKPHSVAEYEEKSRQTHRTYETDKEWWEFFPTQLSPLAITKPLHTNTSPSEKEARARGYSWHDGENKIHTLVHLYASYYRAVWWENRWLWSCPENIDGLLAGIIACEVTKSHLKS